MSFFKKGFSPSTSPQIVEAFLQKQKSISSPQVPYGDFREGNRFNRLFDLENINAKTLILSGKDDVIMPKNASSLLHEKIPNKRWAEIERKGHFGTVEQPQKIAHVIESFVLE